MTNRHLVTGSACKELGRHHSIVTTGKKIENSVTEETDMQIQGVATYGNRDSWAEASMGTTVGVGTFELWLINC